VRVTETRIAFTRQERRSGLLAFGAFTLVTGAWALFMAFTAQGAARRLWPALLAVIWFPAACYLVNRTFGVTEWLRTLVSRRRIPWSDVTMVEAQRRSGQGGSWWVVRAHLLHGRLPGRRRHDLLALVASDRPYRSAGLQRLALTGSAGAHEWRGRALRMRLASPTRAVRSVRDSRCPDDEEAGRRR
jgi:hypothetical protein